MSWFFQIEIVGSNPILGIDVCIRFVGAAGGLSTDQFPVKEVLRVVSKVLSFQINF
jgi:hypothetical protein